MVEETNALFKPRADARPACHVGSEPRQVHLLHSRRTASEPAFDLIAQRVEATDNRKQLSFQGLANVRTCLALALAALTLQVGMIANGIWSLRLRNISTMTMAFT